MAIAIDASTDSGGSVGTSITWSHTCTGSNLILWVGITENTSDTDTGITYNSVAMTLVDKIAVPSERWVYLYYLLNPATGAHSITANNSVSTFMRGFGVSYTGVRQSGVPDAKNTNSASSVSSLTTSVTTVADNCWTILVGKNSTADAVTAGTGSHLIKTSTSQGIAIFDSNADITPAGSKSMQVLTSGTQNIGVVMASFAPAVAATKGDEWPASQVRGFRSWRYR